MYIRQRKRFDGYKPLLIKTCQSQKVGEYVAHEVQCILSVGIFNVYVTIEMYIVELQ